MYYSKNRSPEINIPKNYSGNTFRVIDETERRYINETETVYEEKNDEISSTNTKEFEINKDKKTSFLSDIFTDISVEDILLLGLMLVIHQENPNDTTLLLLLVLLLAK